MRCAHVLVEMIGNENKNENKTRLIMLRLRHGEGGALFMDNYLFF